MGQKQKGMWSKLCLWCRHRVFNDTKRSTCGSHWWEIDLLRQQLEPLSSFHLSFLLWQFELWVRSISEDTVKLDDQYIIIIYYLSVFLIFWIWFYFVKTNKQNKTCDFNCYYMYFLFTWGLQKWALTTLWLYHQLSACCLSCWRYYLWHIQQILFTP